MERIPRTAINAATLSDENPIICIKNKNGNLIIDQEHVYHITRTSVGTHNAENWYYYSI